MLFSHPVKRVSMQDIARVAGVSKNTVSLALRNSHELPSATRKRIISLAAKWGIARTRRLPA